MRPVEILEHDQNKINELVEGNINLVHYVMQNQLTLSDAEKQDSDLFQVGCIGLWKAAQRWDKKISEFHTYAIPAIKNEILHHLQDYYGTGQYSVESLDNKYETDYSAYEMVKMQDDIDFFDDSDFVKCLTEKELDLYNWLVYSGSMKEYVENHTDVSYQSLYQRIGWMRKKWIGIYGSVSGYDKNGKPLKRRV